MKQFTLFLIISVCFFISSFTKDSHSESFKFNADTKRAGENPQIIGIDANETTSKLQSKEGKGNVVRFVHNEQPQGSDIDVFDKDGHPLFRVLIPEDLTAKNIPNRTFLNHQMPGEWGITDGVHWCKLRADGWIEATIAFMPRERGTLILFGVRNLSGQTLDHLEMDVCVSVSHLPSKHEAWINSRFITVPEPLNRDSAGRFWYEKVAPQHLKAFVNGRWTAAHQHPDKPSIIGVPPYKPWVYLDAPASVMAAESLDEKERLFQAWSTPCKVRCAFPGNSCLHLEPLLTEKLLSGQKSYIKGEIALTDASLETLAKWNAGKFKSEFGVLRAISDKL